MSGASASHCASVSQGARHRRPVAHIAWIAAPFLTALLAGCSSTPALLELHGEGLGAPWTVKIAGKTPLNVTATQRGIQTEIDTVAHQLSRWDHTSALSVLNEAPDADWHAVPPELFTALSYALHLASDTGGAYDPTVAPLVDVWGFGASGRRYSPPSAEAVSEARTRIGWMKVNLDIAGQRVRRPPGVQLDLSSMTHGLAADQVATYLRGLGVTSFLIDVGSELRAQGQAQGPEWHVAIEHPPPEEGATGDASPTPIRVVSLRDAGIATSGNYRYFFDYNGRRYSHRIDPRTGEPTTHAVASVTVIRPQCMQADALATALTVLGPDEGFEYAQRNDIAALFILRTPTGLEQRLTPAFQRYID